MIIKKGHDKLSLSLSLSLLLSLLIYRRLPIDLVWKVTLVGTIYLSSIQFLPSLTTNFTGRWVGSPTAQCSIFVVNSYFIFEFCVSILHVRHGNSTVYIWFDDLIMYVVFALLNFRSSRY